MRKIIIGFSKPQNKKCPVFSWAIRAFDNTEYSHVYVKWVMKSGKPIIYQASGHDVNFVGNKRFELKNKTIKEFSFDITDENFQIFLDWAVDESGAPYSIKQAFGIGLKKIFSLKKNPLQSSGFVCSEIAGRLLRDNLKLEIKDLDLVTPMDVYKLCEGYNGNIS